MQNLSGSQTVSQGALGREGLGRSGSKEGPMRGGGAAGTLPGYPAGVGTMLWPGGVSTRPGPIWLLRCALAWAGGFMTGHVE